MLHHQKKIRRGIVALALVVALALPGAALAGNFTELQTIIDNTPAGGTIVLSEDYAFVSPDDAPAIYRMISDDNGDDFNASGLSIDKAITIDGNGMTLSGAGEIRVLYIDGIGVDGDALVLKNVTVTKGGKVGSGSGIYIARGNKVDFAKSSIKENGTVSGVHTRDGGSIFIDSKSVVSFDDCDIVSNLGADRAAGIYTRGNVTITNSRIKDNVGGSRGGGIYVDPGYKSPERGGEWGGNLTIKDSVLTGNKGGRGGALYINPENTTRNTIENCIIKSNDVSANNVGNGGGIVFYNCVASVISCDIGDNAAKRGGGLIVDVLSDVTIDRCTITGNTVTGAASEDQNIGGGILCHDGSHSDDTMKPIGVIRLKNSTVTGNKRSEETSGANRAADDLANDVHIHWSTNADKSLDKDPNWTARYDGSIASGGNNVIGTLVNPKNFTVGDGDKISSQTYDLPADHPDLPRHSSSSSSGCSTGTAFFALAGALLCFMKRR